jgi:hypothetical protein
MTRARDLPNLATNISFSGSNVGIGTTIPSYKLDVSSGSNQLHIGPDSNTGLFVNTNDTTFSRSFRIDNSVGTFTAYILNNTQKLGLSVTGTGDPSIYQTDPTKVFNLLSAGSLTLSSNSTERVRVDLGGNVLIGSANTTGTASQPLQVTGGTYVSGSVGIGTTRPTTTLQVQGSSVALDTRIQSVCEETTLISGNTASLVYNTGGGNIAICTNATGDITLAVTGIPTDSTFNNNSITFSVCCLQTGVARSCTAVTLNGFNTTIRWAGGSLSNSISGVTTTSGMDIYSFTGINTVGSASTTANYYILGSVNGGYR